jgi:DNA primase
LNNVVAPLGTALTQRQVQILKRHAKQVVLVFDGDKAGGSAAERALELFISQDLDVRICTLPAGKDPCDVLEQDGRAILEQLLAEAPDAMEHVLDRLERTHDLTSTHGRYEAARQVADVIARTPRVSAAYESGRRMREWMVLDKVAQRLRIPEATLREQIGAARQRGSSRPPSGPQFVAATSVALDPLERELLEVVLQEPSYTDEVAREVPVALLSDSPLRALLGKCYELAAQGVRPSFARLTAELEDLDLKRVVTDVEASARRSGSVHERLEAVLIQFRRRNEARRAQELQRELRESASNAEKEMELLRQCHDSKRVQQQIV